MARRSSSADSGGLLFKTGIFAVLAAAAFWVFSQFSGKKPTDSDAPVIKTESPTGMPPREGQSTPSGKPLPTQVPDNILPASTTGEIVRHTWFALSYSEPHEQAEWVAYELTRDRLNQPWVSRSNNFRPDFEVSTESATPRDYSSSGYDRGHLCPAADMAFDEGAMDETFLMSNMSPQVKAFNMGVWRELEECTRDWARKFKRLYVATGPVLAAPPIGQIGPSKVTVPGAYYKVLYAPDQHRAIAFLIPNAVSDRPLMAYACTIDQVEKNTGLDFFPQVLKGLNEELEGSLDTDAWPVDRRRYTERVQKWNQNR